jgi:DNA-binding beta-propeller fold protein YncE
MLLASHCGGGGNQKNPPLPHVVIEVTPPMVDVGQRWNLDGSKSTDPNGDSSKMTFLWLLISGGLDTKFDDHCKENPAEICSSNSDDHCSNDTTRFCHADSDCINFGTCAFNSGTTSPDCTTGICELGKGGTSATATLLANVAGPYGVRLTAIGSKSNGTKTVTLNTFPSLYVVGSLFQFGGTDGALVGDVPDAAQYTPNAFQGASNPADGNLLLVDSSLRVIREFDLVTGDILGSFGETDQFVDDPAAITFNPETHNLYVAEDTGRVTVFDDQSGLLITTFGNVGAHPKALRFSPTTGDLLVINGDPGVLDFDGSDGTPKGVLGGTAGATTEPVDLDFLGDSLLIADESGKVVECDADGASCHAFSSQLDGMLAAGSPSAIAVNPSKDQTGNDVLVADPVGQRVISCDSDGSGCDTFGATDTIDSQFKDIFFAPATTATTTTSTSTTTTTTLK